MIGATALNYNFNNVLNILEYKYISGYIRNING